MVVPGSHQWCETREQSLSETGRRGLWLVCKGTPAQWDVQSKGHSVMGRGWQGCLPHGSQGPGLPPLVSTVVPLLHPHGQKSAHTPGSVLNSDLDSERLRQLPVVAQPRSALTTTLGHPTPQLGCPPPPARRLQGGQRIEPGSQPGTLHSWSNTSSTVLCDL